MTSKRLQVDQFISLIHRFVPLPRSSKEQEEAAQKYAPLAHSLNALLFAFFLVLYLLSFAFCFFL